MFSLQLFALYLKTYMKFLTSLKEITKTRAILIAVVVLFLFVFFSIFTTLRWMKSEHMGTVISLDENSFTITNPHGEIHIFKTTPGTKIYKGRTKDAQLQVGDTVLVVGTTDSQGTVTADMIRILKPPKGAPPQ